MADALRQSGSVMETLCNRDVAAAIDAKMAINRGRKWQSARGGVSYHVDEGGDEPPPEPR